MAIPIVRTLFVLWLAPLLMACGGSNPDTPKSVSYDGTTLVVSGVRYERPAGIYECEWGPVPAICSTGSRPNYARGGIQIQLIAANEKDLTNVITEYGLSITNRSGLKAVGGLPAMTYLNVAVPVLFEEQWTEVFRNDQLVSGAWPNLFAYPN
jgi:uncharacterized protein YodC (DUF2158 family)